MTNFVARLFGSAEPQISEMRARDAAALAGIHAASFKRGWSEEEFARLLTERATVGDRAAIGRTLTGFIISRLTAGEAEILSVAIAPPYRGRGLARPLLQQHMRRLAGAGARIVFLEVGEGNTPAERLYRRAGFYEVGRRAGYYDGGGTALVLRRDL
jgi:[ribosomal protein S18]-alanine N-acetyltransferase